jgi:hypothetical protein
VRHHVAAGIASRWANSNRLGDSSISGGGVAWCCKTRRALRNLLAALCNTLLGKVSCAEYLAGQRRRSPARSNESFKGETPSSVRASC